MWQADPTAMHLFLTLLLHANAKTGSYMCGRYQLADMTGLKPTTVYKALLRLEVTEMVTLSSNNKFTIVSICNWHKYQSSGNTSSDNKVTSKGHQSNTKQELRIKNKEKTKTLAIKSPGHEKVSKLFYETIKALKLPVLNHAVLATKIKDLSQEEDIDETVVYLEFMRDKFNQINIPYKPEINNALDIYTKRLQIVNAFKRAIKQQNKVRTVIAL